MKVGAVHETLGEHGLTQLTYKSHKIAHTVTAVCRCGYQRDVLFGILVLIEQGSIQALRQW